MAKTDFKSVDEYQDTFQGEKKERLQAIRQTIREAAPDAEEVISYQIPAYKHFGFLIYYSGATNHISLSYPYSEALLAEFKTELSKYKMSKSALQLPDKESLPLDLIKRIVQYRMKENELAAASKPSKK
ncbi:MAG: iron chaperone [Dyadobacter fermentans]